MVGIMLAVDLAKALNSWSIEKYFSYGQLCVEDKKIALPKLLASLLNGPPWYFPCLQHCQAAKEIIYRKLWLVLCLLSQISSVSVYLMGQAALMAKNHLFSFPDQLWRVQMQENLVTKEILQSNVLVQELLRSWSKVNGCPITPFQTGSECVIPCKTSIFTGLGLTFILWKMWFRYFGLPSFPAISLSLFHIGCIWWRTSVSVCLFVCVILHLQPLHTDLDPSWMSSSDPIIPVCV